jgi:hypothetical protein
MDHSKRGLDIDAAGLSRRAAEVGVIMKSVKPMPTRSRIYHG